MPATHDSILGYAQARPAAAALSWCWILIALSTGSVLMSEALWAIAIAVGEPGDSSFFLSLGALMVQGGLALICVPLALLLKDIRGSLRALLAVLPLTALLATGILVWAQMAFLAAASC